MGAANTPAYRGTAYVVFEELPLERFGNRLPQLSFEVFRPILDGESAESLVRAVTLIPASGEFAYATEIVRREGGDGETAAENVNAEPDAADLAVALDRLEACAPKVESVSLVVAWFGDDLRAGALPHPPGRRGQRQGDDAGELVGRRRRPRARRISSAATTRAGRPTAARRPTAPWCRRSGAEGARLPRHLLPVHPDGRARRTTSCRTPTATTPAAPASRPIPGAGGSPARRPPATPAARTRAPAPATQVAAFFGEAQPSDFDVDDERVAWDGDPGRLGPAPDDPALRASLRRGRRGRRLPDRLGAARDHAGAQRRLELSGGRRARRPRGRRARRSSGRAPSSATPPTGRSTSGTTRRTARATSSSTSTRSGRTTTIDFVGIDNYMPLADWRDGLDHLDAAGADAITDLDYLRGNVEGGEGYDWFYASAADREAQVRTPITDGAAGKPWVFRYKDIRSWWSNPHRNRPGGVESGATTAWVAGEQADPLHRDRLPGGRPRPEPAERLLRPEVGRELPAVLLPRLARRRRAAALPRGGARLLGRAGEQPDLERLLGPDDRHRRDRRLDLGRAAVPGVPGAERRLDRRRQLAARPLAERPARLGLARQPGARALPPRRAARQPDRRLGARRRRPRLPDHRARKPARLDRAAGAALRLRRGRERGRHPLPAARPPAGGDARPRRPRRRLRRRRRGPRAGAGAGDRAAAGAEVAAGARRRGVRRDERRGAARDRRGAAGDLGDLRHRHAGRRRRAPLPPGAARGVGRPRDRVLPAAAVAARARSRRRGAARPRRPARGAAADQRRRRRRAGDRGGAHRRQRLRPGAGLRPQPAGVAAGGLRPAGGGDPRPAAAPRGHRRRTSRSRRCTPCPGRDASPPGPARARTASRWRRRSAGRRGWAGWSRRSMPGRPRGSTSATSRSSISPMARSPASPTSRSSPAPTRSRSRPRPASGRCCRPASPS